MIIFKTAPDFHFDHIKLLSCTLLWFINDSVGIRLEISFLFFHNACFNSSGNNEVWLKDDHYLSCIIYQACVLPTSFANGF